VDYSRQLIYYTRGYLARILFLGRQHSDLELAEPSAVYPVFI